MEQGKVSNQPAEVATPAVLAGQKHDEKIEIYPTAQGAQGKYSDIAMTGLFNAHLALFMHEGQMIWHRHNMMLLANAAVFTFIVTAERPPIQKFFGSVLGLVLCWIWLEIARLGIKYQAIFREATQRFSWPQLESDEILIINPLVYAAIQREKELGKAHGRIPKVAGLVTYLFVAGYVFFFSILVIFIGNKKHASN